MSVKAPTEGFFCWECARPVETVKKCANCLTAIYCNKVCQRTHWKKENGHKLQCIQLQQAEKQKESDAKIAAILEKPIEPFHIPFAKYQSMILELMTKELRYIPHLEDTQSKDPYDYSFSLEEISKDFPRP